MKIKFEEIVTKAKKREIKKRPRMVMHGAKLRSNSAYAGKKLALK